MIVTVAPVADAEVAVDTTLKPSFSKAFLRVPRKLLRILQVDFDILRFDDHENTRTPLLLDWFFLFFAFGQTQMHGSAVSPVIMVVLVSIFNFGLRENVEIRAVESVVDEVSVQEVDFVTSENQTLRTHNRHSWKVNLDATRREPEQKC
jgi:hypothetical protein